MGWDDEELTNKILAWKSPLVWGLVLGIVWGMVREMIWRLVFGIVQGMV